MGEKPEKFGKKNWAGIGLDNAKHVLVTGNRVGNSKQDGPQPYGVVETGKDANLNLIDGNDLSGNAIKACETVGANTRVSANLGAGTRKGTRR